MSRDNTQEGKKALRFMEPHNRKAGAARAKQTLKTKHLRRLVRKGLKETAQSWE